MMQARRNFVCYVRNHRAYYTHVILIYYFAVGDSQRSEQGLHKISDAPKTEWSNDSFLGKSHIRR